MTSPTTPPMHQPAGANSGFGPDDRHRGGLRTMTAETKPSFKTSEMIAYLGTVIAIIVSCIAVDGDDDSGDPFNASTALKYITWVTIGYMVARGLAKAGQRHHDDDGH